MKKVILPVLIFFILFIICVSCSGGSIDRVETTAPVLNLGDDNTIINIYRPPVGNLKAFSGIEDWENLIEKNFNISIKINNISPLHQSAIATSNYYPKAIENGEIIGLIELNVSDFPNLGVLRSNGLILPLDDFLADNSAYNALPESMKSAFRFADGQTWALAVSSPEGIGTRYFRKSWLDELGLQVPQTLDELYEVSKAFAYDDPNANGIQDEYGMNVNRRTGARMLNDIFLANECYLSNYTACSIAFDYTTGAYEDAVLKPGIIESLEYIKGLNDVGILHLSQEWSFRETAGFGNFYDFSNFSGSSFDLSEWEKIFYLGESREKSVIALKPQKCYVLTSNTENPDSVINAFVNIFLSDVTGMAMGSLGIPDENYTLTGNTLTHLFETSDNEGSDFYENNIWLTGLNHDMLNSSGVTVKSNYFSDDYISMSKSNITEYNDLMNNNLLFTDSWFLPHTDYKNVQRSFAVAMYNYFFEMDNISINDYINNYIESAKKAGAEQILYDLNEDAGTFSTFSY